MDTFSPAEAPAAPSQRTREQIDDRFKWNLAHIFPDWDAWQRGYDELEQKIAQYASLQGTLKDGPDQLLRALTLADELGQLEYKVWYFPSLKYDEDQRDNAINGRRQQVQILAAKGSQAMAWFNPELLAIPLDTVRAWMHANPKLAVYRFAIEELYRQQEHVLDDKGEHLLSLSAQLSSTPNDVYAALSTADVKHPVVRLSNGHDVTVTYGQYRAILATNRNQADRAAAFKALH
jgi:oligoendopeptidase F